MISSPWPLAVLLKRSSTSSGLPPKTCARMASWTSRTTCLFSRIWLRASTALLTVFVERFAIVDWFQNPGRAGRGTVRSEKEIQSVGYVVVTREFKEDRGRSWLKLVGHNHKERMVQSKRTLSSIVVQ